MLTDGTANVISGDRVTRLLCITDAEGHSRGCGQEAGISKLTRCVVCGAAMKAGGVSRISVVSTIGAGDSMDQVQHVPLLLSLLTCPLPRPHSLSRC